MRAKHIMGQASLFDELNSSNNPTSKIYSMNIKQRTTSPLNIEGVEPKKRNSGVAVLGNDSLRRIQKQFDELHEEIYKKGGVKPANAAIDEVGKLIFLKVHVERYPHYRLGDGPAKDKLFMDIFDADYVKKNSKKAVRELQIAFREISTLPQYVSFVGDETQTIFPYQEPLRLEHPDVLAMAINILSPLSLSLSDEHIVDNIERQWESFSHQDLLGSAYDVFLRGRYDSAGGLGTYLTPSQVVDCMVKMAFSHISDEQLWAMCSDSSGYSLWQQSHNELDVPAFLMGDICCGTGRFLVRALAEVRARILSMPNKDTQEKLHWLAQLKKYSFLGADQSASSIIKARINFLLFGELHSQLLTVEDSILDERIDHLVGKFDLILTNPPFGEGKYVTSSGLEKMRKQDLQLGWSWKPGEYKKKALHRADPALLFIERNLQLLKPNGLLFIVLPDGILEPAYAYAHEYILKKAVLRAVVSLPRDTFAIAGTTARTSFLCLQKRNNNDSVPNRVFMGVANHVGYLKKGTVEILDPEGDDLPIIADCYSKFLNEKTLQSRQALHHNPMIAAVPEEDLEDSLTPHTYHSDRLYAKQTVASLGEKLHHLQDVAMLVKPRSVLRKQETAYFISVLHVDERSNIDWIDAATYVPTSKGIYCQPNDIIFSCLNPAKLRVAVIPEDIKGEILCSMEFAVIRPKSGEDPYFIAMALKTQLSQRQILPLARGTSSSRRRVREQDLLTIVLPYPDTSTRISIASQFRESLTSVRNALVLNSEALLTLENYTQTSTKCFIDEINMLEPNS